VKEPYPDPAVRETKAQQFCKTEFFF